MQWKMYQREKAIVVKLEHNCEGEVDVLMLVS
jgi:hypothetical protein